MTTTKRLDAMLKTLRGTSASRTQINMRPTYEAALLKMGWLRVDNNMAASEWHKGDTRMNVCNGDRIEISFNNITWKALNATAKQKVLLQSQ